jgi:hypothetical protein
LELFASIFFTASCVILLKIRRGVEGEDVFGKKLDTIRSLRLARPARSVKE